MRAVLAELADVAGMLWRNGGDLDWGNRRVTVKLQDLLALGLLAFTGLALWPWGTLAAFGVGAALWLVHRRLKQTQDRDGVEPF